jgi:hypothetical protein
MAIMNLYIFDYVDQEKGMNVYLVLLSCLINADTGKASALCAVMHDKVLVLARRT